MPFIPMSFIFHIMMFQSLYVCIFHHRGYTCTHKMCLCCSETFPSGCLTLDFALGGGLPKGRIVEVVFC